MRDRIKVAAVQMYPRLMRNEDNLKSVIARARTAAANKAELVVFPECVLPG
jgi:5-aminopentanamidase